MSSPPVNLTEPEMKYRRWRLVRIYARDSDATDSDSDEEGTTAGRHRVWKFVKEMSIEEVRGSVCRSNLTNDCKSRRSKSKSRASRNLHPMKVRQRQLQAAIHLRRPHNSPLFSSTSALPSSSFAHQAESVITTESLDESCLSQHHSTFDSIFPSAATDFQTSVSYIFDNTNVAENSYIFTEQKDWSHVVVTSSENMDSGFPSWHRDDFFQGMADFSVLDPIVSLGLD